MLETEAYYFDKERGDEKKRKRINLRWNPSHIQGGGIGQLKYVGVSMRTSVVGKVTSLERREIILNQKEETKRLWNERQQKNLEGVGATFAGIL